MLARSIVRKVLGVFSLPFGVILYLNIEKLAEAHGWDGLLSQVWEAYMPSLYETLTQPWLAYTATVVVSFTAGLWADLLMRASERRTARPQGEWSTGKTRFTIREAACFITDVPPTAYATSDRAQAIASELIYYARKGYINLAGEDDHARRRQIALGVLTAVDEDTYLGRETVQKIKTEGLSSWLPHLDRVNSKFSSSNPA